MRLWVLAAGLPCLAVFTRAVGGRSLPGRSPKVAGKVAQAPRMSARRIQTSVGARHRGRLARKDAPVAITAIARGPACLIQPRGRSGGRARAGSRSGGSYERGAGD